jgi:hypothetical protein
MTEGPDAPVIVSDQSPLEHAVIKIHTHPHANEKTEEYIRQDRALLMIHYSSALTSKRLEDIFKIFPSSQQSIVPPRRCLYNAVINHAPKVS